MCIDIQTKKNPKFNTHPRQPTMINYPCGKCALCTRKRLSNWIFRIEKEMQRSKNNQFITLTYDNEHLPHNSNICKRDIQLFFKRLRKNIATKQTKNESSQNLRDFPLRYITVGEYGELRHRPHYHILLFNSPDDKEIKEAWNMGRISSSPINESRIRYVFKYISKPKQGLSLGRQREFQLTSRGIGSNYLTDETKAYHNRTLENCYIIKRDGHTMSIPKYYKNKIYDEDTQLSVTEYQKNRIDKIQDEQINKLMLKFRISEKEAQKKYELSKLNTTFVIKSTPTF